MTGKLEDRGAKRDNMADDESDSDERVESEAGGEDDVIEEGADAPPEIPFDAEKSELVLD